MSQKTSTKRAKRYQSKRKKTNKLLAYGFSKNVSQEAPAEKKNLDNLQYDWIPFGDDNLFPQMLSELSRCAATHRAILNTKTTFTMGEGISCSNEKTSKYFEDVNANAESINDVMNMHELKIFRFCEKSLAYTRKALLQRYVIYVKYSGKDFM